MYVSLEYSKGKILTQKIFKPFKNFNSILTNWQSKSMYISYKYWAETLVLWLWEQTHDWEVVSSNQSTELYKYYT